LAISSPWLSVTSKRNLTPEFVAFSVIGQVHLEAPQILDAGGVG